VPVDRGRCSILSLSVPDDVRSCVGYTIQGTTEKWPDNPSDV
jgi:hypothetical protein